MHYNICIYTELWENVLPAAKLDKQLPLNSQPSYASWFMVKAEHKGDINIMQLRWSEI